MTSGFTSPANMNIPLGTARPPLFPTEVIYSLQGSDGQMLKPEIFARIDKGFFLEDHDWTTYRRNYLSLSCSYTLLPSIPSGTVHLASQTEGVEAGAQVCTFAMSIAAVVDGRNGKPIELVQHTPKRDKGPQQRPDRITLHPRQPQQHSMYSSDSVLGGSSRGSLFESQGFNPNPNLPATEAIFERIQFKNATANKGKRRTAQQYHHLVIELFADVGQQHSKRWVKIATRMSARMVVRGRPPGKYQSETRGSNATTGRESGGDYGSCAPGISSQTPDDLGMSGGSSILLLGNRNTHNERSHDYRPQIAPLQIHMERKTSAGEAKGIEETPSYLYHPTAIYEEHESRYQAPSMSEYAASRVRHEDSSNEYLPSSPNVDMTSHWGDGRGLQLY